MIYTSIREMIAGRTLVTTVQSATVREACHHLAAHNVGALPVLDADGHRLVGMFSERDVIRKCICGGRRTDETMVAEIMTPDPQGIQITKRLADALGLMKKGGFRHVPVMEGDALSGMLSIRDIPLEYRLMHDRFQEYRAVPA